MTRTRVAVSKAIGTILPPVAPARHGWVIRERSPPIHSRVIEVLILCTANVCRSPAAEGLLRDRLSAIGVDAQVRSAGVLEGGVPASSGSVDVLARRGIDLTSHRSRTMSRRELGGADLIIGMAREHVREAAALMPEVWPRTFTLKELVRRGEQVGIRRPDEEVVDWLGRAGSGRSPSELLGHSVADDVADPYGQSLPNYERMISELDHYIDRLVALLWAGRLQPFADARPGRG